MKAFRKVMCIVLAVMLAALAVVIPVSAAKAVPLVVVKGLAGFPLVKDLGTDDEKQLFPFAEEDIQPMVTNLLTALVKAYIEYGISNDNWDVYCDALIPVINKYIDPIAYNPDGTPKYDNVTEKSYDTSMAAFPVDGETDEERQAQNKEREEIFTVFGVEYAKQYGDQNVYSFGYDWRVSPLDAAEQLDEFIAKVKKETGSAKVNVVAISEGAAVTLAYMDGYNCKNLNNVVFASPAWQGTSLMGWLFTGDIELDIFTMENYLVQLGNGSFVTHFASVLISSIASYEGLSHEYFAKFNYILQKMLPRLYSDTIRPLLSGMPGLWSLVPGEYYEAAKAYMFPEGMDADFEAKLDAYYNIQSNAKAVVEAAEEQGVRFGIVCGYNCQIAPVNEYYPTSDTVVDTKYASGGATCAEYLKAFSDWGTDYTQVIKDEHDHVSWDQKVDASTCMFREQVWFIKNLQHVAYNAAYGTTDIVMWLLSADEQYTVHTDEENYPQFSLYNTYTRTTKPCPTKGVLGDVDFSTAVTVADARLALLFALEIETPNDDQVILGDIDEDGKISTDDARSILCMALGIELPE